METLRFFAVVFLLVTVHLLAQQNSNPSKSATDTNKNAKPALTVAQNDVADTNAKKANNSPPKRDTPLSPEWVAIVVAIVTAIVIGWQAIEMRRATAVMERNTEETRKSAEAARKSVDLQEVGMQQWVDLKNWQNVRSANPDGNSTVAIYFDIINPTNWPLTLVATAFRIGDVEVENTHLIQLPPKEPYTVHISNIPLDDKKYLEGGEGKTLRCMVTLGSWTALQSEKTGHLADGFGAIRDKQHSVASG